MKYCFSFSILNKEFDLSPIFSFIETQKTNLSDTFKFFFYVCENNKLMLEKVDAKKDEKIEIIKTANDADDDGVTNHFFANANGGGFCNVRSDVFIRNEKVLQDMLKCAHDGNKIVTVSRPCVSFKDKVKRSFKNFFSKIIKFILGFELYGGDYNLMFLDGALVSCLKEMPYKICKFSKVDNFFLASKCTLESDDFEIEKNKKRNHKLEKTLWICSSIFVLILVSHILLCHFLPVLNVTCFHILPILAEVIFFVFICVNAIKLRLFKYVGELYSKALLIIR
ncbi:MAG: hypothetical protein RR400_03490 [Clostridia bacterium]